LPALILYKPAANIVQNKGWRRVRRAAMSPDIELDTCQVNTDNPLL